MTIWEAGAAGQRPGSYEHVDMSWCPLGMPSVVALVLAVAMLTLVLQSSISLPVCVQV